MSAENKKLLRNLVATIVRRALQAKGLTVERNVEIAAQEWDEDSPALLERALLSDDVKAVKKEDSILIANIWRLIKDYENPGPETAAFVPRENFASTLRTLLMSAGHEWEKESSEHSAHEEGK